MTTQYPAIGFEPIRYDVAGLALVRMTYLEPANGDDEDEEEDEEEEKKKEKDEEDDDDEEEDAE
jgi:hypothetical protein